MGRMARRQSLYRRLHGSYGAASDPASDVTAGVSPDAYVEWREFRAKAGSAGGVRASEVLGCPLRCLAGFDPCRAVLGGDVAETALAGTGNPACRGVVGQPPNQGA